MRDDEIFETDLQEIVADLEGEVFGEVDEAAIEAGEVDGEGLLDEILAGEVSTSAKRGGATAIHAAIERQRRRNAGFARAVRGLTPYVRRRGARLVLAIPTGSLRQVAARLGVKVRGVEILARSAALRPTRPAAAMARELAMEVGVSSCPGRSEATTHWWGAELWLNECQTKALLALPIGAAAAYGTCAAIVPPATPPTLGVKAACAAAAGALTIGAGALKAIDDLGGNRGIVVKVSWAQLLVPVPLPFYVWHQ